METATFAAGCFWGVEEAFRKLQGVRATAVGFMGGDAENPSYKEVCTGRTGHAEVVQVEFDPARISYADLLEVFWASHDPTQLNRQGADVGTQYRSAIFYHSPGQERVARDVIDTLEAAGTWDAPVVTEVVPAAEFYPAEAYHQSYYRRNLEQLYCQATIAPKVAKLRQRYAGALKPS